MQNQSLLEVGMFWRLHCIYNNHEQLDKSQDNGTSLSHPSGIVSGPVCQNYIHSSQKPHCFKSLELFLSPVYKWDEDIVKLDKNDESCITEAAPSSSNTWKHWQYIPLCCCLFSYIKCDFIFCWQQSHVETLHPFLMHACRVTLALRWAMSCCTHVCQVTWCPVDKVPSACCVTAAGSGMEWCRCVLEVRRCLNWTELTWRAGQTWKGLSAPHPL